MKSDTYDVTSHVPRLHLWAARPPDKTRFFAPVLIHFTSRAKAKDGDGGSTPRVRSPRLASVPRARRRAHRVVAARAAAPAAPTGAWNLDGCPDGIILSLARRLEAEWTRLPNVRDAPCAPELKSVDATAPDGDPATRIRIENLCLQTDAFRKMHLEVAWGLGGLEVLHCVIYPWAEVAAPIFAADLVAFGGRVTLCIADASPCADDLSLPRQYVDAARALRRSMLTSCPAVEPRPLPDWGVAILSPEACVCVGPPKEDFPAQTQTRAFVKYLESLHGVHPPVGDQDWRGIRGRHGRSVSGAAKVLREAAAERQDQAGTRAEHGCRADGSVHEGGFVRRHRQHADGKGREGLWDCRPKGSYDRHVNYMA